MTTNPSPPDYHDRVDPHMRSRALADVVLGGQDGLVNVLGVLLGVAAASGSTRLVLAAGLATTAAESLSMAAVAFTTARARGALYDSERARELRHIARVPDLEKEEVRQLFAKKGFQGALLERVVQTITADKDVWVAVMMSEEHALAPVSMKSAATAALVVGISAAIGSLLPLAPYVFFDTKLASVIAVAFSAVVLLAFGAYGARGTSRSTWKSGLEMAIIGMAAAMAGYGIGLLFRVPPMP